MHRNRYTLVSSRGGISRQLWWFEEGAVGDFKATGVVRILWNIIDEYFPSGVEVHNIKIVEETVTCSYKTREFRLERKGQKTYLKTQSNT